MGLSFTHLLDLPERPVVVGVLGRVEESLAEGGDTRRVREHLFVHRPSLNLDKHMGARPH
jgi:hypothetical protein